MHPDASQPDPLQTARAAYLAAKEPLIERLRADWRDEDTRANLELIQRRLAELDEIERRREEQRQEQQQDQDQQGDGEGEGDGSEDPSEGEAEGEESSPADGSGDPNQTQPGQGEEEPQTQAAPRPAEGEGEARSGTDPSELAERHLTREEVMRLLDKLGELEEAGAELEARLREARRIPVDRDW